MARWTARALRVWLAALLAMTLAATGAMASGASVWINSNTKVYSAPSKSAKAVNVPAGLGVKLVANSGGWGRVTYKSHTAYIPLKYLTLKNPVKAYLEVNAAIYRRAGSGRLGTVPMGTVVYVVGVSDSYARVLSKTGRARGYVKASALTRNRPTLSDIAEATDGALTPGAASVPEGLRSTATSASASKIEYTIFVAQNLIGAPYAEHASPPTTFDCAKFAYYCYGKARSGALRGSSRDQGYDDRYERIDSIDELERGDLVCFDTTDDFDLSDHVGIYLGGGYFIHASSAGKRVMLSQLNSGYYNRVFSWGRRIFES